MGGVTSASCGCLSVLQSALRTSLAPVSKDPYEDLGLLEDEAVQPAGLLSEEDIDRLLNESKGVINSPSRLSPSEAGDV